MSTKLDEDVELARNIVLVAQIKRNERLQSIGDYVSFVIRMLFGVAALIVGGIETADPNILPIQLSNPLGCIAVGVGLLGGKKLVSRIAKASNALKS